jgi:hypothetical protein
VPVRQLLLLGPRLVANRKAFQLNNLLVAYSALQVVFSVVTLWEVRRCNTVRPIGLYLNRPNQLMLQTTSTLLTAPSGVFRNYFGRWVTPEMFPGLRHDFFWG